MSDDTKALAHAVEGKPTYANTYAAFTDGMRAAAEICGSLAETTYDDSDSFEAATGCEAAIMRVVKEQEAHQSRPTLSTPEVEGSASWRPIMAALVDRALADDHDHMVAEGEALEWLMAQLANPHRRVHPDRTMCDRFIRMSAVATLRALLQKDHPHD